MKNLTLILATTLMAATTAQTDEGSPLSYRDVSGRMSLTVSHAIDVHRPIASRNFSFDLALAMDPTTAGVTVTIDHAQATYTAHDMKQRLGTRHLTGQSFSLSIADDGRRLQQTESSEVLVIDLGPPVAEGFSIASLLADTLPVLPGNTVAAGTTWSTSRRIRSLGGWAWGTGQLTSLHRVTSVNREDDHTIVTVATEAKASLDPVEEDRGFSGDLKRTLSWTFDATEGRLLSMSMEQETEGICPLPQGESSIHQLTRVELTPTP